MDPESNMPKTKSNKAKFQARIPIELHEKVKEYIAGLTNADYKPANTVLKTVAPAPKESVSNLEEQLDMYKKAFDDQLKVTDTLKEDLLNARTEI